MMMNKAIFFLCFFLLAQVESFAQSAEKFLVCGDSKVLLVDYTSSKDSVPNIIWQWDAAQAAELPDDYRTKLFRTMDDCKAINNGRQVLVSSSSGAIAIINIDNKKVVFVSKVPNAHSIALLPGGFVVAAASTNPAGNKIMVFDINKPEQLIYSDSLYSAHGVVWNEKRASLFALGYDVLREYKLSDGGQLKKTAEWKIPGIGGHELQPAPGGNQLYVTEHGGSWIFDIISKKFSKSAGMPDAINIKSLGKNAKGQYIFTIPEESWWTFHVRFSSPERSFVFPGMKVYKARWFNDAL